MDDRAFPGGGTAAEATGPAEPDGTVRNGFRVESDSLGKVRVPADRYWGAETQRCLTYLSVGENHPFPKEVIEALALLKKAAALANLDCGVLAEDKARLIVRAASEVEEGKLSESFPLHIFTSGSGTQINMNVNEVIANRAIELAGGVLGTRRPVHPNDHVNMSQSTNDIFPSAVHAAIVRACLGRLSPCLAELRDALSEKAELWADIPKIGRTHLMDALPLMLGAEFSGYAAMLDDGLERIRLALPALYRLPVGGTAVGTGFGAPEGFAQKAVARLAAATGLPFVCAPNRFALQGAHDAIVMMSGVLRTIAVSLHKIAEDIRLLGSGPRCGIQELALPANEPGSSMMPGKINPTQCESLAMVAVQVMAYDSAVAMAGAGGSLEMNAYKPVMAFNIMQSIRLISDSCLNFARFCISGLEPNRGRIEEHLHRSLMLATALTPVIGHDRASQVALLARREDVSLREAAVRLGYLSAEEFDRLVDPKAMARTKA